VQVCIIIVELHMVVEKWGRAEVMVVLDHNEHNQAFKEHSIEGMDGRKGKTVQADRNNRGDGSHVFKRS